MNNKYIHQKILAVIFGIGLLLTCGFNTRTRGQGSVAAVTGGSPRMTYEKALLRREDVQRELNLSSLQKEFLTEFVNQTHDQIAARAIQNMSPIKIVDATKFPEEIGRLAAAQVKKFMEDEVREVNFVLRPEQQKRLHEIDLQWRGILALSSRDVADEIDLSAENRTKMSDIITDFFAQRINLINQAALENKKNGGSDLSFMQDFDSPTSLQYQKRQALVQEFEERVLNLLSNAERERWRAAIGTPFVFSDDIAGRAMTK